LARHERLVLSESRDVVFREQYRRIAAALHETQIVKGLKALVVTSALPREGKTLTTVNLALTFSETYGRKVLLIDADLRRPSVHEVLGLPNTTGLSEALRVDRPQLQTLALMPLLDVLLAGHPERDPLEGLASPRMKALVEHASTMYDWVIIDTPPLTLLSDAQVVAGLTQAAVFVIRAGSTPFEVVTKALDLLGRDLVVGTVLNGTARQNVQAAGYYGHYYNEQDS
jgi:capsular exopolysaccharide synthesis family protein